MLFFNRVLLVDRQEERRGEWLAIKFFSAVSAVSTSMSIPIQAVGKAMVSNTLLQPEQKTEILENKAIASLGKSTGKWHRAGNTLRWQKYYLFRLITFKQCFLTWDWPMLNSLTSNLKTKPITLEPEHWWGSASHMGQSARY